MEYIYNFLLVMWKMKRIDKEYLDKRLEKGQLTQEEYNKILECPQCD